MAAIRKTILYSGRVQGVGFRFMTIEALRGFEVTGFVRNLRDGRVELVLEGEPETLDQAAARVRSAMAANIDGAVQTEESATGEFSELRIAL